MTTNFKLTRNKHLNNTYSIADASGGASIDLVNSTGGTANVGSSLVAVLDASANDNFTTIAAQFNKFRDDVEDIRTQLNEMLHKLNMN